MSKPAGYSQLVEINGPHRTIYLAGQTGIDANGKVAEGFRAQAVQVMENIKTALASVGGGLQHVVKLTSYLTNLEANGAEFREVRSSSQMVHRWSASPDAAVAVAAPSAQRALLIARSCAAHGAAVAIGYHMAWNFTEAYVFRAGVSGSDFGPSLFQVHVGPCGADKLGPRRLSVR